MVASPQCAAALGVPQVSCGVSPLEQVPLADTKTDKSSAAMGPRRQVRDWLTSNGPDNTSSDASPGYDAMKAAIDALKNFQVDGKRFMLFITDGGFSCTSLSNPLRNNYSDGFCPDWEQPFNAAQLLSQAHADPMKPVESFIVGVPGSNSNGQPDGAFFTPPYHMRLALSFYAFAGSPNTVPADCNGRMFTQSGGDPTKPCHFDMTTGNFNATALADIINDIRGKALGCTYDLPEPPPGETIDKGLVNVLVELDGKQKQIPKRGMASDDCATNGCWDYNSEGKVELIGAACKDLSEAKAAKVDVLVGCKTIIK